MVPLSREKLLAAGFGTLIVLWFGAGIVGNLIFGPFRTRGDRLETLRKDVSNLEDQAMALARARKELTGWKAASLPPDRGAMTARRPDAADAQRLYQSWLTDAAHLAGFESFSVRPSAQRRPIKSGKGTSAKTAYITVGLELEADGRFSQLCTFLDYFHRTNLLHRISSLNVDSADSQGDPLLKISLQAEGLALVDVPWRRTLFPETTLVTAVNDQATTIQVASSSAFPKKAPFRIRAGNELMTVTGIDGDSWTLERGVDRTFAQAHSAGVTLELAPVKPGVPSHTTEEFRQMLAGNIFIKPPPPKEYRLKIGPLTEQAVVRGSSLSLTIPISDYDPTLGRPEFVLKTTPPPGMVLDRGVGKLTWTPVADQAVGSYPVEIEVKHPSAADGAEIARVAIVFREPNLAPKINPPTNATAYIGRAWTWTVDVSDAETPVEKLAFKLESPPEGMSVDAAKRTVTWTPPATVTPGPVNVVLEVTDQGLPPQSVKLTVPVTVEEDAASFTYLVGSVAVDGVWQAWLYNRAADQRTVLRQGDKLQVADVTGEIAEIGKDFVLVRQGEQQQRLRLGQNLRELTPAATAVSAAP